MTVATAGAVIRPGEEQPPLTAVDMRDLYRSLECCATDRRSRLDQVRNDQRIRRMVDDNTRLRHDMMIKALDARDYRPQHPNERIEELLERDDQVEAELHEAQLALDALDQAIDEVRARIQRERQADVVHDHVRRLATIDTRLEKRQAHALTALNQTDTKVRELRTQSEQTSRETTFLAGVHAQLAKDRKTRWAAIGDVLRRALAIVDARTQSRAALQAAQSEMQRDFEQFERQWLILCDVIESERLQRQMFARYTDFYAAKVEGQLTRDSRPLNLVSRLGGTDISKNNISRARWTRAALMAGVRTSQARLQQLRRTLEQMCGALRDLPLDQVADRFQHAEDRNYANFAALNDLRQHVAELADDTTTVLDPVVGAVAADPDSLDTTAYARRFQALHKAFTATEDAIRALNQDAVDLAEQFQVLRSPAQAVLALLVPGRQRHHDSADFLDLLRSIEQGVFDVLDRVYKVNAEEPPPVDMEADDDAGQYDGGIRIDPPTLGPSAVLDSSDDEFELRSVVMRDVRSAPPILRRPPSRTPRHSIV